MGIRDRFGKETQLRDKGRRGITRLRFRNCICRYRCCHTGSSSRFARMSQARGIMDDYLPRQIKRWTSSRPGPRKIAQGLSLLVFVISFFAHLDVLVFVSGTVFFALLFHPLWTHTQYKIRLSAQWTLVLALAIGVVSVIVLWLFFGGLGVLGIAALAIIYLVIAAGSIWTYRRHLG
jgi:hypothetical protein